MTAGYSGTPLWKKLGLKDGMAAEVINPPDSYSHHLLSGSPVVNWGAVADQDFVHLFTTLRAELEEVLTARLSTMARDGMIWVSWPKKTSKVPTEVIEDTIREVALPIGLVDVKVCAVTEVWSGLKLMIRKELR
ncbi:DUF3052 family protein [Yoonia sp. R2331]|uniref:DUF3052 family protein n=1 Tax=Yoonia sp. R2331 TaxID=3237238 RepID=UPI0034E4878F